MERLLLQHKADLQLDDWPDEAVVAAAPAIVRSLAKCVEAARLSKDVEELRRLAWFTGDAAVTVH
jgi:hypothetical protein